MSHEIIHHSLFAFPIHGVLQYTMCKRAQIHDGLPFMSHARCNQLTYVYRYFSYCISSACMGQIYKSVTYHHATNKVYCCSSFAQASSQ